VKDVYIVAAKRTPFGTYGGKLANYSAIDLQEIAARAALQSSGINPEIVNGIVVGNVFHVRVPHCNFSTHILIINVQTGNQRWCLPRPTCWSSCWHPCSSARSERESAVRFWVSVNHQCFT
jgi:hypothetical protein